MKSTSKLSNSESIEKPRQISLYISYTHRDGNKYVSDLKKFLHSRGVMVFLDTDINPGDRWVDRIQDWLVRADAIIAIITRQYITSDWSITELDKFRLTGRPILPIVFEGVSGYAALPRSVQDIQYVSERERALRLGPSELVLAQLTRAIERIASTPAITSIEPKREYIRKKRPLNEGKLILVGRGEVGKTSLVRRLSADEFRGDESKTQGINITKWSLRRGSASLRLNVWDFGGQEIMHATHQFFLTQRSLYLLVLNGREGGEDLDAEYWIRQIESFGGDSPIIIVQNKIAQHPFELNYRGLRARYPQIYDFIKTDCSENIGIDELRGVIRKCIGNMPEIRMPFPVSWFKIKKNLESLEDDFMGYESFRELCINEGIKSENDIDTLCWVLHCLGIALNYKDDPRLRETSVLKPEWVTQGIYKILNAQALAERQGEMHVKDLQSLLPNDRYPTTKHHFILELMRKFSLCVPFPEATDRYLVPELLGKEEAVEVAAFTPTECLNFEYQYGILPEGLLPRFIVRSHTLSRGQARWRSGVILAHEDSKALVTADPVNRQVIIRVKGGSPGGRRSLLAIIRYDLDRINGEFKDRLEVNLRVPLTKSPHISIDYNKLLTFERNGMSNFPEVIDGSVMMVDVHELLNGVDLEAQRRQKSGEVHNANAVFFSYSHKDEALRDELETHLKLLQRQQIISTWYDRKIVPGYAWQEEIDSHMQTASIILLLISSDFIASDYCWGKELAFALERHAAKLATIIPVILRACDWDSAPFGKLQGLPKDMKPITSWQDRDAAWTSVARGVRTVAQSGALK
jgi:internalin A